MPKCAEELPGNVEDPEEEQEQEEQEQEQERD